jgi:murein lipoprotein
MFLGVNLFRLSSLIKECSMKFLIKILPVLVLVAATGCASNSQVDEVRAIAEEAQRSATAASSTAAKAQSTANAAQTSANAAQTSANEANEKVDRAFQKSMEK